MTNDSSDCLSRNDISRYASRGEDRGDASAFGAHLQLCERCQTAFSEYMVQTVGLEKNLSRLTLDDIENASRAFNQEREAAPRDLEGWLGKQADRLAEQTALFSTPCRLGQYELHGLIAPGGMGEVYRATHTRLKREVAVKVIRRNQQESQVFYENFLREIETLGQLDHPNMVRAFDALEFDGYLFLVMELLDGESLKAIANKDRHFSLTEILGVMQALARAIQHLHDNGYLHLDIKPSNVMVLKDGEPKLIDYGLAMPLEDTSRSGVKVFRGTAGYMPPEQLQSGRVGRGTDIFAAGTVFSFLLSGSLARPLNRKQSSILESLNNLIEQMTDGNPDSRISDASIVADRLAALLKIAQQDRSLTSLSVRSLVSIGIKTAIAFSLAFFALQYVLKRPGQIGLPASPVSQETEWSILLSRSDLVNSIGMPLNVLPDGKMTTSSAVVIGKQRTEIDNVINVPSPLYVGMCEVTQQQYESLMEGHTNQYPPDEAGAEMQPAEAMTIEDAMEFCRRLSNLEAEKKAGRVYRIPTADEWELACRAGATTDFGFGDKVWQMAAHGWYNGNSGSPKPVGSKRSNGWGFFDMHGNVGEWVIIPDEDSQAIAAGTGVSSWWGFKGGSWAVTADQAKCSQLNIPSDPQKLFADGSIGFRVVCNLLPSEEEQVEGDSTASMVAPEKEIYTISIDLRDQPNPKPIRISNAKLFRESETVHYWTTENLNEWAEIEYRFELPAPIESVIEFEHLAWVYNQNHYPSFDPYCQGTVEVAGDDQQWHVIFHSESGVPVVDNRITVLPLLKGSTSVGLRAKLFCGRRGKYVYYSQFLRRGSQEEPHKLQFILDRPAGDQLP
jgi:serine/threonine protein kinase